MTTGKHRPPPSNLSANIRFAGAGTAQPIVYRLEDRERGR